jgi:hypothetical protein
MKLAILRQFSFAVALCSLFGCASAPNKPAHQTAAKNSETTADAPATRPSGQDETWRQAAAKPSEPFEGEGWQSLFDGQTLKGWKVTDFAGRGEVECKSGLIALNMGDPFTGVNHTNQFPKINYEIALDAMRVSGSDFFCGLTVPVGDSFCSLIVGGWGGTLVGISSLDGMDASENETTKFIIFDSGRWYRIRLRITDAKIQAWIDKDKVVDVETKDRKVTVRPGDIEMSEPLGIAAWQTTTALREIKWRPVTTGK